MREFVSIIEQWPDAALRSHMRRHDFSKWIAHVAGDYPLSKTIESLEVDQNSGNTKINAHAVTQAIRARYQLLDPKTEGSALGPA